MRSSALCRRSVLDGAGQDATRLVSPQLTLSAEGQSRLARRRRGAISRLSDPATLNSRSFPTPNPPHGRHWCRGISLCPFAARSPPSPRLRGQPHPNHALLSNKTHPTGVASLRAASAARAPKRGREAGRARRAGRSCSPRRETTSRGRRLQEMDAPVYKRMRPFINGFAQLSTDAASYQRMDPLTNGCARL